MKSLGHIAFICSGNICRSPMAEAITREMMSRLVVEGQVSSAGTLGLEGHSADKKAMKALSMLGIDLSEHRSRGITQEYLREADAIVVSEEAHATIVELIEGSSKLKIHRLWRYTDKPRRLDEIRDPVGCDLEEFLSCRDDLVECLRNWLDEYIATRC